MIYARTDNDNMDTNKTEDATCRLSLQQLHRKHTSELDLSKHPSGFVLVDVRKKPGDACGCSWVQKCLS